MKVLIDADGCPVVDETVHLCKRYNLTCLLLCDTAHTFCRDDVRTLVFDKGADRVDYALAARVSPGDIVITQDYGLAAMCLVWNAHVFHQDGWKYTQDNIDALLFQRHTARKHRAAGERWRGYKKRTSAQNAQFAATLETFLQTSVQG